MFTSAALRLVSPLILRATFIWSGDACPLCSQCPPLLHLSWLLPALLHSPCVFLPFLQWLFFLSGSTSVLLVNTAFVATWLQVAKEGTALAEVGEATQRGSVGSEFSPHVFACPNAAVKGVRRAR